MIPTSKIDQTILFVKEELKGAEGGHDWFHVARVYKNALTIAKTEECNLEIIQYAALLHDIADSKFHNGDEQIGPQKAATFLHTIGVDSTIIDEVILIIENLSFKGGHSSSDYRSLELDIVQDADRLDAIGAIGIARTFNYGGYKNRLLYNPDIAPKTNQSKEEYKNSDAPTLNHFYEKLLLLKDKMNTRKAKELAIQRHKFMETYLSQFYAEWEGEV